MKKTILLSVITFLSICTQLQAKSYYIRVSTNTSDWSNITPDNVNSFIVDYDVATSSLSSIINAYLASDSVWIAKGTYKITGAIAMKSSMIIRGGFAGTESVISARATSDLDANGIVEPWEFTNASEIISANTDNTTTIFSALNFPALVTNATVDGITIKGIVITGTTSQAVKIFDTATGSMLKNSIVKDCSISGTIVLNGAVYANNGTIQNCLVQNNLINETSTLSSFGGGISAVSVATSTAAPKVIGCVMRGNKITNTCASPATTNKCKGGGVFVQSASALLSSKVINCVVYNNEVMTQGGGIYVNDVNSEVINCTVAKNSCGGSNGAGVFLNVGGKLNNCVVWGNIHSTLGTPSANDIFTSVSNTNQNNLAYGVSSGTWGGLTSTKLLTSGATADNLVDGTGTLAPKFLKPTTAVGIPTDGATTTAMTTANFQLTGTSPSLDYGSATRLTANTITTDLMNGTRFLNTLADLGAYEGTYYSTTITFNANGTVGAYSSGTVISNLEGKSDLTYTITPNSGYKVTSVLFNDSEVKDQLVAGVYAAPALNQISTLNVIFDLSTAVSELKSSIHCFAKNNEIQINGLTLGDNVMIYGVTGNQIASHRATSASLSIPSSKGVYLVRVANQVSKIIVN